MIVSKKTISPSGWGDGCLAWDLLSAPDLCVKHEEMPSGTCEIRHYHARARQFFFVLDGELTMVVDAVHHVLSKAQGIAVDPGQIHQARNDADGPVEFLVISAPSTAADRIENV
ncbi:MAG: cupin domain-containing protein [Pseudomonadota bacterium]